MTPITILIARDANGALQLRCQQAGDAQPNKYDLLGMLEMAKHALLNQHEEASPLVLARGMPPVPNGMR